MEPIRRVTLKIRRGTERVPTIPSAGNALTSAKMRKGFSPFSAKNPHSLQQGTKHHNSRQLFSK
jgi:hypothetical protein